MPHLLEDKKVALTTLPLAAVARPISALFLFSFFFLAYEAMLFAPVMPDAGYYLSLANRIAEGVVPFKDFATAYTPLASYLFALIPTLLGKHAQYEYFLFFQILVEAGCAYLLYLCAVFISSDRKLSFVAALTMLITVLGYDGIYIVLEPFVIFFSLLSFYWVLIGVTYERIGFLFLAGIATSLGFLSKQYGIGAALPICCFILLAEFRKTPRKLGPCARQLFSYLLGITLPLTVFAAYFCILNAISLSEIFRQLSGARYGDYPFRPLQLLRFFFRTGLPLLFLPWLVVSGKSRKDPLLHALWLFILVFALPLFYNQYNHYFILLTPFVMLLGVYMLRTWRDDGGAPVNMSAVVVMLSFIVSAVLSLSSVLGALSSSVRIMQINLATELNAIIPRRSRVLALVQPGMIHLCDFYPADPISDGYAFPMAFTVDEILKRLRLAQYVVLDVQDVTYFQAIERRFELAGVQLGSSIRQADLCLTHTLHDQIQIWQRRQLPSSYCPTAPLS